MFRYKDVFMRLRHRRYRIHFSNAFFSNEIIPYNITSRYLYRHGHKNNESSETVLFF